MNTELTALIDRMESGSKLSFDELHAIYDATYGVEQFRPVMKKAEYGLAVIVAEQNEQKRAEAAAKHFAKFGSMTASWGEVEYLASRSVAEYVAGKPVFGSWVLRCADIFTDAEDVRTFCTASELTDAMRAIRPLSEWQAVQNAR